MCRPAEPHPTDNESIRLRKQGPEVGNHEWPERRGGGSITCGREVEATCRLVEGVPRESSLRIGAHLSGDIGRIGTAYSCGRTGIVLD